MKKKPSLKNVFLYSFLLLILNLVVLELFSYGVICFTKRSLCSYSVFNRERRSIIGRTSKDKPTKAAPHVGGKNYEVIHPYLGYVHDPYRTENRTLYGFQDDGPHIDRSQIPLKEENVVTVGVFGGSFAGGTVIYAREKLIDTLKQSGSFGTKDVVVYNFALPGYKQPQQLMALTYLLSLGARFDIVINIDGFNEIALPEPENISKNVYPFFPIKWNLRVTQTLDTEFIIIAGNIQALLEKRSRWANFFNRRVFRYSMTCNLAWKLYDRLLSKDIAEQTVKLKDFKQAQNTRLPYVASGPDFHFGDDSELYSIIAKVWYDSSLQMSHLCRSNNIRYFHFIQPNQYVENSKPMNDEERSIALSDDQPYKKGVLLGYAYISNFGTLLKNKGVNLNDLTYLFIDNTDVLYSDNCCHLNKKGYTLVAEAVGKTIVKAINVGAKDK